jgi:hypothetical protein
MRRRVGATLDQDVEDDVVQASVHALDGLGRWPQSALGAPRSDSHFGAAPGEPTIPDGKRPVWALQSNPMPNSDIRWDPFPPAPKAEHLLGALDRRRSMTGV